MLAQRRTPPRVSGRHGFRIDASEVALLSPCRRGEPDGMNWSVTEHGRVSGENLLDEGMFQPSHDRGLSGAASQRASRVSLTLESPQNSSVPRILLAPADVATSITQRIHAFGYDARIWQVNPGGNADGKTVAFPIYLGRSRSWTWPRQIRLDARDGARRSTDPGCRATRLAAAIALSTSRRPPDGRSPGDRGAQAFSEV